MSLKIDITSQIEKKIQELSCEMKGLKWTLNRSCLGDNIVKVEDLESRINGVHKLCTQANPSYSYRKQFNEIRNTNDLFKTLDHMYDKIAFAKRVMCFLRSNSQDYDPRLKKIYSRLLDFEKMTPIIQKEKIRAKLNHYSALLHRFSTGDVEQVNKKTHQSVLDAQITISKLRLKLLDIEPEAQTLTPDCFDTNACYEGFRDIEECKKIGSLGVIKCFLNEALSNDLNSIKLDALFARGHNDVIEYLNDNSINRHPPEPTLMEVILLADEGNQLVQVFFPLPSNMNCQDFPGFGLAVKISSAEKEILSHLVLLKSLKEENSLKKIGAALTIGDLTLGVAVYDDNSISLIQPQMSTFSNRAPCLMTFGSSEQAASFIHQLLIENTPEVHKFCLQPIHLFVICHADQTANLCPNVQIKEPIHYQKATVYEDEMTEPFLRAALPPIGYEYMARSPLFPTKFN